MIERCVGWKKGKSFSTDANRLRSEDCVQVKVWKRFYWFSPSLRVNVPESSRDPILQGPGPPYFEPRVSVREVVNQKLLEKIRELTRWEK